MFGATAFCRFQSIKRFDHVYRFRSPARHEAMIETLRQRLRAGMVIPAHPLALDSEFRFDERGMRRLSRYYHASGAGGVAVGVHTTQFAIRLPEHGLFRSVLQVSSSTIRDLDRSTGRTTVLVAGVCGPTRQAVLEAEIARDLGYDAALVSLAGHSGSTDDLVHHLRKVAETIPVIGFYLQRAVGGIHLDRRFWRRAAEIENLVAVKIAPFNRYATLDVVRGVVEAGRANDIALYTGNDDNIVGDLLTRYQIPHDGDVAEIEIVGGLLGQWACWTATAVELHRRCRSALASGTIPVELLTIGAQLTEANSALFDVDHDFRGCIPGIHYALQRNGLMDTVNCLNPHEVLSPGQADRIDRLMLDYPHLTDALFVSEHLEEWRR